MWDSGRRRGGEYFFIDYQGAPLESFRRYDWSVRWGNVRGELSPFSPTASFGTGALDPRDWTARWIAARNPRSFRTKGTTLLGRYLGDVVQSHAVYLRKEFPVLRDIARAMVYICGLGYYELTLNGRRIGDHVLDPGWTDYARRALYAAYDLTGLLATRNAFGAILGNGRHIPYYGYGSPRLFLELIIEHRDGSTARVVSDASWKTSHGPLQENGIYFGETYDARLEREGWDRPGFAARAWEAAVETSGPLLVAQAMPPIRIVRTLSPRRSRKISRGVRVFDFGQNFAGWVRVGVRGPRGAKVRVRHAELIREDGTLNTSPNQNADATDFFILKGRGTEVFEPRFSYHGFRFAEVAVESARTRLQSVEGRIVHSDLEASGRFRSSHPVLNGIQSAILRGQNSNLMSIPTDCPQRDERQGWLGDAHLSAEQAACNFDMAAFWTKYVEDIRLSQRTNGSLPDVVPPYIPGLYPADPAWGSAYPILVWLLYWRYGDARTMERNYEGLRKYVDFLWSRSEGGLLRKLGKYGDWCPPGSVAPKKTPVELTSTWFMYHDTLLIGRMAGILGKNKDARLYTARGKAILAAFNRKFLAAGAYSGRRLSPVDRMPCQTSQVLPLALGMVPRAARPSVIETLMGSLDDLDFHLDTGILGTRYLLDVLTENGRGQAAFRIATQTSYPGWGYMIKEGATTLWERWEKLTGGGMNSQNHIMFGSIGAWFYAALAGIRCLEPGWKRLGIKPLVPDGLRSVRAEIMTIRGRVRSEWTREGRLFRLRVEIPVGAKAEILLPLPHPRCTIRESGRILWSNGASNRRRAHGIRCSGIQAGSLGYELESGQFDFSAR